mmetsp:Transcript_39599/g.105314  ORF Transcript_39599/g.105314 Transcript_39599/m.105314 type:complete len:314 (+) Transcript_39599:817-1758(+)
MAKGATLRRRQGGWRASCPVDQRASKAASALSRSVSLRLLPSSDSTSFSAMRCFDGPAPAVVAPAQSSGPLRSSGSPLSVSPSSVTRIAFPSGWIHPAPPAATSAKRSHPPGKSAPGVAAASTITVLSVALTIRSEVVVCSIFRSFAAAVRAMQLESSCGWSIQLISSCVIRRARNACPGVRVASNRFSDKSSAVTLPPDSLIPFPPPSVDAFTSNVHNHGSNTGSARVSTFEPSPAQLPFPRDSGSKPSMDTVDVNLSLPLAFPPLQCWSCEVPSRARSSRVSTPSARTVATGPAQPASNALGLTPVTIAGA